METNPRKRHLAKRMRLVRAALKKHPGPVTGVVVRHTMKEHGLRPTSVRLLALGYDENGDPIPVPEPPKLRRKPTRAKSESVETPRPKPRRKAKKSEDEPKPKAKRTRKPKASK